MFLQFIGTAILSSRSEFCALIPGGGTDGSVPFFEEQLRDTDSETVYFDLSKSSMFIVKSKVQMRGSLNGIWIMGWI